MDEGMKAPEGFGPDVSLPELMSMLEVPDSESRTVAIHLSNPSDEFEFALNKMHREDNATFSQDGVESLVNSFRQWLMCRIWKRWQDTGQAPQDVTVTCSLEWKQ